MKNINTTQTKFSTLRQRAEALLKEQLKKANLTSSEADMLKLIHELKDNQIELEIQNKELVIANEEAKLAEITLLKEKELAKDSEEKFRAMYNNAPLSYQSLDENGCFIDINPMWLKTLGYERDEVIGKWYGDFLHPDYVEHFRINFPAFKKRGYVSDVQFKLRKKDNTCIFVSFEGCVGYTPEGKFKQTYCVFKDITEQKAIENALIKAKLKTEESEARYRLIADNTSDSIWLMDADLRFTYLSPSTEILFGYTLKEWETLDWNTFIEPDYIEAVLKVFGGLKSGKQESVNPLSVIVRHKNGTKMWIEFSACPLFDENEVFKSAVGITRDITERKLAELQIKRQKEHLQELNATKDRFFTIIAHDLKSPFTSILGFSELLVKQISEKDYDGIEQCAGFIRQSSQKAVDLLMNLMEWSRSQTGRMKFNPMQFDIMESILEITTLFDNIAGQKGIAIKRELPPKTTAFADLAMINTVLRNLISNAIKFTKPGGEIIITVTEEKNKLTVAVKDNGIGISKDRVEKLFQIGENKSFPGTANEKGTGLGLILCKEFVEKNGGKIWVESEEGKGSMFSFTIPDHF